MLSQQTIDIVKSTAPILQEHGETLTKHFYKRMFSHNPEVLPFFNPANQTEGTQQRALANAICAYAANIDNLEVLGSAVELIAQKHASLQIKPEHYPIVGENLLESIREVLGEAANDDIINAWGEAYGFLADILIGRETQIYDENKNKRGGWEGFRSFTLDRKETENELITSFYLKPSDGGLLPDFLSGQYITLRMPTPDGQTTMRNYSLSNKSGEDYFRISVKKEISPKADVPDGYVSNTLHKNTKIGTTLEIGTPCGEFFFDSSKKHERPLVFLAAGVGITPIFSMLQTALTTGRDIVFVHGCLNEKTQAFKSAIDTLASKHSNLTIHYRYSDAKTKGTTRDASCSTGFIDIDFLNSIVPEQNADYYFCGPKPFMTNIYQTLGIWKIPKSQIHLEFFGPREELEEPI
ncbi:MAG: NO-inducible flavohemoprotein [Zetaproteobacteria bacterium]|nr:MAG: NO-inducible flavohemoprotein [Zetaproteobacteria bacterium]